MRRAAGGPLVQVKGHEIDEREAQIMQVDHYDEGEPEADWTTMAEARIDGYNP